MERQSRSPRGRRKTIGLNIALPFEQCQPYITRSSTSSSIISSCVSSGSLISPRPSSFFPAASAPSTNSSRSSPRPDRETRKKMTVLLYGESYWRRVLNLEALADAGTIAPGDVNLFQFVDTPEAASPNSRRASSATTSSRRPGPPLSARDRHHPPLETQRRHASRMTRAHLDFTCPLTGRRWIGIRSFGAIPPSYFSPSPLPGTTAARLPASPAPFRSSPGSSQTPGSRQPCRTAPAPLRTREELSAPRRSRSSKTATSSNSNPSPSSSS